MFEEPVVIVCGVGYKEAQRIWHSPASSEIVELNGINCKLNIGAATAKALAKVGTHVCMVSTNEDKLEILKQHICDETKCDPANIFYYATDLRNERSVRKLVASLDKNRPVWLVHSIGLSSGMYNVQSDNPYLPFKDISADLMVREFEVPVRSLLLLVQCLEPFLKKQEETRIVVVTSMSSTRPFMYGYSHAGAKAGIHQAVRSLSLELSHRYNSVYVSEILPGIVDTGMYDSEEVIQSVREIGESFGFFGKAAYSAENFPLMPPSSVAEAVLLVLRSNAHILSIDLVAKGQFLNSG